MKTVLITGSTSGIGKTIATSFAQLGYNIIFNGLEADGAAIAQDIATQHQIQHLFFNTNMLDVDGLTEMVAASINKFGKIDILVNNAGIQFVSPIQDFPKDKFDAIIGINLSAPFHLAKLVWPSMMKHGFGRIINIASAHGLTASANKSAYVASKHGMIGLTKTLAIEGAPHNITCNTVCPGYVYTPIIEKQIPDQMTATGLSKDEVIQNIMLAKQPIKEFIPIQLIADAVLFLSREEARTLTGIAMPIDGGWTAE
jgi:3-hydroxybutyrate dehydrogenase